MHDNHRRRLGVPHRLLCGILSVALAGTAFPAGAFANGANDASSAMASALADHLYIPEGVTRGIVTDENGVPQGLSSVYGEISSNAGVSTMAEFPEKFDLRDVNGTDYVTPVKNQYGW